MARNPLSYAPPDDPREPLNPLAAPQWPGQEGVSQGDAWNHTLATIDDWLAQQRADAKARGLWDDETGFPTRMGMLSAVHQYANAMAAGTQAPGGRGFIAYHGSPHNFAPTPRNPHGEFDPTKIGTGEGNQAFGYGAPYLAENEGVARGYRDGLTLPIPNPEFKALQAQYNAADAASGRAMSGGSDAEFNAAIQARDAIRAKMAGMPATLPNPSSGHMYEVQVNANPEHFLDWDKPLSEQSLHVREALANIPGNRTRVESGAGVYSELASQIGTPGGNILTRGYGQRGATDALKQAGIPGIRYLDGGSRGAGEGSRNYVMFNPDLIQILRKYGLVGTLGAGAAANQGQEDQ